MKPGNYTIFVAYQALLDGRPVSMGSLVMQPRFYADATGLWEYVYGYICDIDQNKGKDVAFTNISVLSYDPAPISA
jgi:hypothetical protein